MTIFSSSCEGEKIIISLQVAAMNFCLVSSWLRDPGKDSRIVILVGGEHSLSLLVRINRKMTSGLRQSPSNSR
jgi:hypothetical protein